MRSVLPAGHPGCKKADSRLSTIPLHRRCVQATMNAQEGDLHRGWGVHQAFPQEGERVSLRDQALRSCQVEGGFRAFWTVDAIMRHSETRGVVGSGGPEAPGCSGGSRGAAGMGKATREASHAFVGSCQRPESTRSLQVPSGGMGWKMEPRWEAQLGTSYRSARAKRPVPGPECGGPRCG